TRSKRDWSSDVCSSDLCFHKTCRNQNTLLIFQKTFSYGFQNSFSMPWIHSCRQMKNSFSIQILINRLGRSACIYDAQSLVFFFQLFNQNFLRYCMHIAIPYSFKETKLRYHPRTQFHDFSTLLKKWHQSRLSSCTKNDTGIITGKQFFHHRYAWLQIIIRQHLRFIKHNYTVGYIMYFSASGRSIGKKGFEELYI